MSDPKKINELLRACETGDLQAVKSLIKGNAADVQDDMGHTPLQVAAANDQVWE